MVLLSGGPFCAPNRHYHEFVPVSPVNPILPETLNPSPHPSDEHVMTRKILYLSLLFYLAMC